MESENKTYEDVQEYYGKTIKKTEDLKTDSCCPKGKKLYPSARQAVKEVHDEIIIRYYGCGNPIPECLDKAVLLDLGSGTGRDVYIASKLVGPEGKAIGIDMTEEQLAVAREYQDYHSEKFGFKNTEFVQGFIEDFVDTGKVEENSADVVISNCVVNLSPRKDKVLRQVWKALKEGGELYFSDIYCDRRVPQELQDDKVLWGECLSGALYLEDFRRLMAEIGFTDLRIISSRVVSANQEDAIREKLGDITFYSITIRAFKIPALEDRCEDYQIKATYKGGITDFEDEFVFDENYTFIKDQPLDVCKNTALILSNSDSHIGSRYAKYFEVTGDGFHKGKFCKQSFNIAFAEPAKKSSGCCKPTESEKKGCCKPATSENKSCCKPSEAKSSGCCDSKEKKSCC